MSGPSDLSRRTVVWLIPIFLTMHNAEEAVAFRTYLPRLPPLLPTPIASLAASLSYATMLIVLIALSAIAFLVALAVVTRPESRPTLWVLLMLETTVAVNVIAHVVTAATVFHGYAPGLATALLINAPFAMYCLRRVWREQWLSPAALWTTVPASLVLHGPILMGGLWLGGRLAA